MPGKNWIGGACLLLLAGCSPSMADELARSTPTQKSTPSSTLGPTLASTIASFATLDRNADQRLSRSEAGYDRLLSAIFADSDRDGDGFLTPAEYAQATGSAPVNL